MKTLSVTLSILFVSIAPAVAATIETTVRDGKGKPVEEAVVYLAGPAVPVARTGATATMDQQHKEFIPYVLPVELGTAVSFPNRDNIRHHVYSFSPAKKFELPLYAGTPAHPVVFDKNGPVVLGCNIHDWMVGYVLVVPTPYFAKTGPDGKAHVRNVPPGDYELRVWHPRMKATPEANGQRIVVGGAATGEAAFTLSLKPEWRPWRRHEYQQHW